MATIENFILRFKTEGTASLGAIKGTLKDLASQSAQTGTALDGLVGRLGPLGAAAGASLLAIGALGMKAVNLADELADLSDATGIGADQLLNLKQSMAAAGGSSESFSKAATRLAVSIGEAMGGNEKYQKSFRDLGVFVTDSSGKIRDSGDILTDVVGKLAQIEDPAVRSAKAVELLGKEAAKIDWSKVSAGRDAITAEQIAQLAKYRDELDKLRNALEVGLLKAFGNLAEAFNKGGLVEGLAAMVEQMGMLISYIPGLGKVADLVDRARMERLGNRAGAGRGGQGGPTAEELAKANAPAGGGYGGLSEAKLKAIADSKLRIEESRIEKEKQIALRGQGDIAQIEINAKYELAKFTEEIKKKEKDTGLKFSEELAAKEQEIFAKRDTDIAKNRLQTQIRIMNEQMALEEQNAKEMAAYYQQVDQARLQAYDQVQAIKDQTAELQGRFDLQQKIFELGAGEQERQTKLFDLEQQRKATIESIAKILSALPPDERLRREQELNAEYEKRIVLINKEADARNAREQDFSAGIKESMKRYEESLTPLKQGQQMAEAVFSSMGSALDKFVETGKFNFGDFAKSVIQDLIKIQLRAAATQLLSAAFGSFFPIPGKAAGGPVQSGQPYIVGEKGPELFMPNSAGTIVPNDKLSGSAGGGSTTNNYYSISAIDAKSVAQLFAENKMTLLGTVRQAEKELPFRGR